MPVQDHIAVRSGLLNHQRLQDAVFLKPGFELDALSVLLLIFLDDAVIRPDIRKAELILRVRVQRAA